MADTTGPRAPREVKTELVEMRGKVFRKVYVGPTASHGLVEEYWIYIGMIEVDTDQAAW
ncbi:hypothetical protein [Pseudonocardia alaniniphila]|uniref:Uncharacterized protein n=1 Tax=Pseudonocardia alaniniphila TaxID=75291 RepID=A0ABS9TUM4_9PSEU|nr:hypothetical protein [Pseudonocardia alaniniphila]MCH6172257.1 hypothetical protein [Pseudonocardia alaniniphila]